MKASQIKFQSRNVRKSALLARRRALCVGVVCVAELAAVALAVVGAPFACVVAACTVAGVVSCVAC